MLIYPYYGYRKTAQTVYFSVATPAATDSDTLYNGADILLADVSIFVDGVATATTSATVTRVGSTVLWALALTDVQTDGECIFIALHDASGTAWRDAVIILTTTLKLGQATIDPTNIGGNTVGLTVKGVGTQPAISAAGGATSTCDIDGSIGGYITGHVLHAGTVAAAVDSTHIKLAATASSVNDYYNSAIAVLTGGTGAGQARAIVDYVGSTNVAEITTDHPWTTPPSTDTTYILIPGSDVWNMSLAEVTAPPSATSGAGAKLQLIFQRFAFKIDQTATLQTWYSSADAATMKKTVDDDGTTQTSSALVDY